MQIAMIGLGRMGGNIVRRLVQHGHSCVVYDRSKAAVDALAMPGVAASADLQDMVAKLQPPRIVWVMLPAGEITEHTVTQLGELMQPGDIIIDGGNSFFKDDVRRARQLAVKGISYIDCGTSGGVWGLERGYCLMIGGDAKVVAHLDPIFKALAPGLGTIPRTVRDESDPRVEQGYMHCGPAGSGRFVKMVHNGIEYGLMQAYAEGFEIMQQANSAGVSPELRFDLNLRDIAEVWRRGSVVSSWLLDLSASALAQDQELSHFSGVVEDSGEGRWTVMAAVEEAVPADVLSASLYARFRSRQRAGFANKLLSAMRNQFGGHTEAAPAEIKHDKS